MVELLLLSLGALALVLNRKSPAVDHRPLEPDFLKIRCPLCEWRPCKADRWVCATDCLHRWNTFDTAGLCPACTRQWNETACLRCWGWSPHRDWYEHEPSK